MEVIHTAEDKKYYWLKLKRDFFKRHDIQIIESQPNGKDYVLFYLKLLVESVDHNGQLRFSDTIPYDEKMLSTITNTNIDIVRAAMKVLTELNLIEVLSDRTIYMFEIEKMVGSETYWAEQKRISRKNQPLIGQSQDNVQTISKPCPICPSKSKKKSKSIEIDKKKNSRFVPPSLQEVQAYCHERNNGIDAEAFIDFYSSKGWKVGNQSMKDWKAAVRTWEKREKKSTQSKPQQNKFNQYPQREYSEKDYAEMERKLINRT